MKRIKRRRQSDAELDITAFMNLMIILVPVLLMTMVFSHITVLDLRLPDAAVGSDGDNDESRQLELVIRPGYIDINYPQGVRLKRIDNINRIDNNNPADNDIGDDAVAVADNDNGDYDFTLVSTVLQEVKRQLRDQGIEKRDILVLAEQDTDYQTLVGAMDTVRSFEAVVATSVVRAELFPDIALGDAPVVAPVVAPQESPLLAEREQP